MKSLSLLLLLMLPFSLMAEEGEWFAGIEGGATGVIMSEAASGQTRSYGPEFGAKAGIREDNGRIYVGVTSADNIDDTVSKTLNPYIALEGVSDEFKVIAKSTAKFYIGVRFGASIADIGNKQVTAALVGVQSGLIFLLPADFEIELAYRHYMTFREKSTNFNAGAAYGGLNYKFGAF